MAFDEAILQRIRIILNDKGTAFEEKEMFSGVCIMVDEKMCCGTHANKKTGENMLLFRIGEAAASVALEESYVLPMNFTGRAMKGYVFVSEAGFKMDKDLDRWLQLCLDFNPRAKKSARKSGNKKKP